MIVLNGRNVNHLLPQGIALLKERGVKIAPRGMETLEMPCSVASVYERPQERVLFDPVRDANPFFHFMEGLWIIGGRNDVKWLAQFNKRMVDYSDDGRVFHGAYGHRLRMALGDQVAKAITMLQADPDTRRCVLQIWDAERDLDAISRDIPCNDLIMLKVRDGKLNMTVCNRSNDIVWGCYGANAVHFSMLQEYIASMAGFEIGTYTQISDSYHVYTDNPYWQNDKFTNSHDLYITGVKPKPLVDSPRSFDTELEQFFKYDGSTRGIGHTANTIFNEVAIPMYNAWWAHKMDGNGAIYANQIKAEDWRFACLQWLDKRGDVL